MKTTAQILQLILMGDLAKADPKELIALANQALKGGTIAQSYLVYAVTYGNLTELPQKIIQNRELMTTEFVLANRETGVSLLALACEHENLPHELLNRETLLHPHTSKSCQTVIELLAKNGKLAKYSEVVAQLTPGDWLLNWPKHCAINELVQHPQNGQVLTMLQTQGTLQRIAERCKATRNYPWGITIQPQYIPTIIMGVQSDHLPSAEFLYNNLEPLVTQFPDVVCAPEWMTAWTTYKEGQCSALEKALLSGIAPPLRPNVQEYPSIRDALDVFITKTSNQSAPHTSATKEQAVELAQQLGKRIATRHLRSINPDKNIQR